MNGIMVPALFALYVYAVFKVILFKFGSIDIPFLWHQLQRNLENPVHIKTRLQLANFVPLESISNNIQGLSSHDLINLFGNIAVFMPYGIFLLLMSNNQRMSLIGVFTRSLGLSLCLECLQVVFSIGSFDVDDLILNVSGGLLGYGVFKFYTKFTVVMLSVIQDRDRTAI
ncbi:VanZ family protein [Paenibacillus sp. LMG 31456]|uniref:VanZ family protein n=2 Tax=Paenibacillus foliorum TaxID=2654974 RepID=A0A972H1V7_9BACL|nr:VanZ family protein [Paenibacillus foliorum]